ncbi:hypothetical protein PQX77_020797 [Marasmius sp. AFHP31]|nr:hypothetical protein PQX77_020797 [Marasmius sp. AFHP31]
MRLPLSSSSLLLATSLSTGALAGVVKRATPDRSNVVENSKIKDPNQECSPYWYPPSDKYPTFPSTWDIAKIVPGDTAATNAYNSIKSKIVNSPQKGQNGVFTATSSYNTGTDPDCWWTATGCVTPKTKNVPSDVANIPEPMSIGYGFDDGPNCSHNAFYDFLQEKNQKATMFFIGSNVINWPLEAQRALYDGHEMCAHSWSHNAMTTLTNEQAFAEVYYTIKSVTGVTVTCWRPPYGDTDDRIRSIVNALGLSTVLWQYDSNDWMGGSQVDGYYNDFINKGKSGSFSQVGTIFLQHEINDYTMGKAMQYYPDMTNAFKHLVPVAVALNKTNPYAEKNIEFPTFNEYISGTVQKPLPASALSFLGVTATSSSASPTSTSKASSSTSAASSSAVSSSVVSSSRASSSSAAPSSSVAPSSSSAASSTRANSSSAASSTSSVASSTSSRASSSSAASSSSVASSTSSRATSASSTPPASSSAAPPANTGIPALPANPTQDQWVNALKSVQDYLSSLLASFNIWNKSK